MFPDAILSQELAEKSPLFERLIVLVASPESGADLIKRALGSLPGIAAAPVSTNLFSSGLAALLDGWHTVEVGDRRSGFADLADEQELLGNVRRLADELLVPLAGTDDDFIVEYSPTHIRFLHVIEAVYPDAHILHVVRDGGDVVAAMASPDRLRFWARPAPVHSHAGWPARVAAEEWCDDQREAAEFCKSPNYRVARLERVIADPSAFLGWLVEGLGIAADADDVDAAAAVLGGGSWTLRRRRPGRPQALLNAIGADVLQEYDYPQAEVGERRALAARVEVGYESLTARSREVRLNLSERLHELSLRWASEATEQ
ncbi:MAG: sulfotransferase [Acidimicrobiia bacterium]|nr:sulfotransferase [Acidimicrobiia bacterium]